MFIFPTHHDHCSLSGNEFSAAFDSSDAGPHCLLRHRVVQTCSEDSLTSKLLQRRDYSGAMHELVRKGRRSTWDCVT